MRSGDYDVFSSWNSVDADIEKATNADTVEEDKNKFYHKLIFHDIIKALLLIHCLKNYL